MEGRESPFVATVWSSGLFIIPRDCFLNHSWALVHGLLLNGEAVEAFVGWGFRPCCLRGRCAFCLMFF